jgi:hypothetical protein
LPEGSYENISKKLKTVLWTLFMNEIFTLMEGFEREENTPKGNPRMKAKPNRKATPQGFRHKGERSDMVPEGGSDTPRKFWKVGIKPVICKLNR